MKPLNEYLKPAKRTPDAMAADLRGMISRMAQKQGGAHGTR